MTTSFRLFTLLAAGLASSAAVPSHAQQVLRGAEQSPAVYSAHLPSLRGAMAQTEGIGAEHRVRELKLIPLVDAPGQASDPVVQGRPIVASAAVTTGIGIDGIGKGLGSYSPNYAPPDTTGAVGATQYVQWVNVHLAVFKKDGTLVYGPALGNTLFQSLGGACASNNDGDPIVQYDKVANRWVLSQFAVPGGSAGYWQCVAVSKTSDATGGYWLYAFQYSQFNDYPKMGVWSDGYYVTFNIFTSTFQGAKVCAYDRAKMLVGDQTATQQCFQLSSSYASLQPADLDGSTAPPAGTPNYLVNRLSTSLGFWKFKVDWNNAANTTLTGPAQIPVAAYSAACGGGACVPQPNTNQKLDSLADRLMFRLAYRNFGGGDERMVVNHAVMVNQSKKPNTGNAAVRWYEIRNMSTTPSIFQQSSFSPDTSFRWMGSAAMDKLGNMAVGYSLSSSSVKPKLAYATRLVDDAAGTLSGETTIVAGGGSQLSNLSRWGDYTQMSIDPVDDCTFWYTGQYLKANGTFNWSTRIASFKITTCQ
jgi:hypothetical protein